ncbi:hypothetical protein KP509_01G043800 [Ceratopteris richardii]|uniref:NADH-quinone oxidoreductase subunit D domain-containing protein n=1 Tax=Ceratopteris richardii TaxID=49495 RepID=A0A8T2VK68_CERRI|nr:hypothetical protein KP509_01G043800 [Ceratopteris richardii]
MGPQHLSMRGVLRLVVVPQGENVIDCKLILGYLHRGMEKFVENRTIVEYLPYVMRWDYLATMFTEAVTASYICIIMLELSRVASHLLWLGPFLADIEREMIYDLFEVATGMRMMHNYFRIGGVAADLLYGWVDKCLDFCQYRLPKNYEYERLITRNPIFLKRVKGVGFISRQEAINWGLSTPCLRASRVQWDLRKIDHYECYDKIHWQIKWQIEGDSLARYLALKLLPGGPYENLEGHYIAQEKGRMKWNSFNYQFVQKKSSPTVKLPRQEHYVRVEAPKGELGVFLIGDDSVFPWRFKIRPSGFANLQILPQLLKGMKLVDIMTI